MGGVRDVVASMTPEEVLADKEAFKQKVQTSVDDKMNKMGLELVSLNIQDISNTILSGLGALKSAPESTSESAENLTG